MVCFVCFVVVCCVDEPCCPSKFLSTCACSPRRSSMVSWRPAKAPIRKGTKVHVLAVTVLVLLSMCGRCLCTVPCGVNTRTPSQRRMVMVCPGKGTGSTPWAVFSLSGGPQKKKEEPLSHTLKFPQCFGPEPCWASVHVTVAGQGGEADDHANAPPLPPPRALLPLASSACRRRASAREAASSAALLLPPASSSACRRRASAKEAATSVSLCEHAEAASASSGSFTTSTSESDAHKSMGCLPSAPSFGRFARPASTRDAGVDVS